jgi:hypothetical protein
MERRDLQGLTVTSPDGREATVAKGGLLLLDGNLEVRFCYRGGVYPVTVPADASTEAVKKAIAARLPALDEALDLAELIGLEVEA